MIKGFIFNLDGLIVNTSKYHSLAWGELANTLHIDFKETQLQELQGKSDLETLQNILNWGSLNISATEFNELIFEQNRIYLNYINQMEEAEILPDVSRVLNFLKQHKQLIALSSTDKNAKYILRRLDLFDEFHVIVDSTLIPHTSPTPKVYLAAAEKLHISPTNCFVFENTKTGIEAANRAKMIPIGIGNPDTLDNSKNVFCDFTETSNSFLKKLISK